MTHQEIILKRLLVFLLFLLCALPVFAKENGDQSIIEKGSGSFVFRDTKGDKNKLVTVWYFNPGRFKATSPILFVMHGVKRDGKKYRDAWQEHANKKGVC